MIEREYGDVNTVIDHNLTKIDKYRLIRDVVMKQSIMIRIYYKSIMSSGARYFVFFFFQSEKREGGRGEEVLL